MRVVVDTNVFISAALKDRSLPGDAVHLATERDLLLKSSTTFLMWLGEVLAAAELVPITERIVACRDPKDDKFLELAVNGRADLIVSGDADLLALSPFRGIPIITPAAYAQGATQQFAGDLPYHHPILSFGENMDRS
jgi:uncharacterized protein